MCGAVMQPPVPEGVNMHGWHGQGQFAQNQLVRNPRDPDKVTRQYGQQI
jgi:hypothetical protein